MSVTPQSTRAAKNHAFQPLVATTTVHACRSNEEYFQPEILFVSIRAALLWLRCPLITCATFTPLQDDLDEIDSFGHRHTLADGPGRRGRTSGLPDRRKPGPTWVFIPDLDTSLWYAETAPDQKTREAIEAEMWKRAECVK
jgi:hypothetical protein